MEALLDDQRVVQRVLDHIDHKTTDVGTETWREPVANYTCAQRFSAELEMLRRLPIPFCPSAALPEAGAYVARNAAGIPLVVVRGDDGRVRAFRNACRHRGMRLADGSGLHEGVRLSVPRLDVSPRRRAFSTSRTIGRVSRRRQGDPRPRAGARRREERTRLRYADSSTRSAKARSTACRT